MTVDILNRRFVNNDEKEEILEKEKILTNIMYLKLNRFGDCFLYIIKVQF